MADGVGDESDSDPSLATKFQMADGVERSKYTMSGCMPLCRLLLAYRPSLAMYAWGIFLAAGTTLHRHYSPSYAG